MAPNEDTEIVAVPRIILDRILASTEEMTKASHKIESLTEGWTTMQRDIVEIKSCINGNPQVEGVMSRLRTVEKELAAYKRVLWIAATVIIGLLAKTVYSSMTVQPSMQAAAVP